MKDPLLDLLDDSREPTTNKLVPNVQPTIKNVPYKLAIIGEAPGADEVAEGVPFTGYSGQLLNRFLSRFGILRDACFIGNICQQRPSGNKIATFDWDGPEIQGGLSVLKDDLALFQPNCVLCLGGSALHAFKSPNITPKKRKTKDGLVFVFPNSIGDWRGSFFTADPSSARPGVKCIAAYHPAACLRQYEWSPLLMMDIQRAFGEATTKELILPQRNLKVGLSLYETCQELDKILTSLVPIGTDIEGYWNNWSCISFAPSPDYAFIVPLTTKGGASFWSEDEEIVILKKVTEILSNPRISKTWQNGLYDRFCTQFGYGIVTRGPSHDIMLKTWELYCELEKSLSMQCSLYTKEPYYKSDRHAEDIKTFHEYCCKDSCVTKEIDEKLDKWLSPTSKRHYDFNLTLLNALLYMEIRGIKFNQKLAAERLSEINTHIYELQHNLNTIIGQSLTTTDKVLLRAHLRDSLCYKRDPSKVKVGNEEIFDINMRTLLGEGDLSSAEKGRLETALGLGINVDSPKQLTKYLYETLNLPEQRDPKTKALTVDYEALLNLKKKSDHPSIPLLMTLGELSTRRSSLKQGCDTDGRIRGSYNEVGSETGRVTCGKPPTKMGFPLQTAPNENDLKPEGHPLRLGLRDLLQADEGCYLAKCDLKGADGWTIGANLASLGDSTMLDDLRFGLKPASILCYAFRHGAASISGKTRSQLLELCKEVKKSDWDYFAMKVSIWGICYLMGARKSASEVYEESEGTVEVKESDMQAVKDLALRRYRVNLWWDAMRTKLVKQQYPPKLTSPSGHTRMFFGRKDSILGEALAHEPQSVTTYATNQAVYRCWTDVDNRYRVGTRTRLRVEPLHQVHDEFLCQFRIEDTAWATAKIKSWFNNEINIAGIRLTIPYEGSYGTDWAMNDLSKKGSF